MSKTGGKFVLGLLIGAGAALLLAPKSGKELRADLKNKFEELKARINEEDSESLKKSFNKKIKSIENDLEELDKETILKLAKEKATLIEEKLEDLIVAAGKVAKPKLEAIAEDLKKNTIKTLNSTIKKIEGNTKL